MYKFFLALLIVFSLDQVSIARRANASSVVDPRLSLLKQHVVAQILEDEPNLLSVKKFILSLKSGGSWPDIDYTDKTRGGWLVAEHLSRLLEMSIAFSREGSSLKNNRELDNKINEGLNFWLANDFICPNWWYPEIGVPRLLGPIMLLREDRLSPEQKEKGLKILARAKIGMTGQNRVWLSGNVICRSLLTNDYTLINEAALAIKNEVVVSEKEGIQPDYSFHQHGPQQQFGNYGSAFAADILRWGVIFRDTPFQFPDDKTKILSDYLLKGMRWVVWKNQMDISACGRQLFPDAQKGKARNIAAIFARMPLFDPSLKTHYEKAMDDFSGNVHFWKSDMTVHRRNNFYVSVKMSSSRVAGSESCNSENIQGYHLGDGACYLYQSGNEYTNIFPFWDWKRIPGTTTYHDEEPLPVLSCSGYLINSDFVGGVSDGMNGVATLAYLRDGLKAQKSWFFFNEAVVSVGAGISSDEDKVVNTTVNQSFLHGPVVVKSGNTRKILSPGDHHLDRVQWVIHDQWGYFFPDKPDIKLSNKSQMGTWHQVLERMPPRMEKADLFTLWLDHGLRPRSSRYAWYAFPGATAANMEQKASEVTITANTDKLQVAESFASKIAGFVFVNAGSAQSKLFGKVSVDKPSVMMLSRQSGKIRISLSDPGHKEREVIISLEGKSESSTFESVYDAEKNITSFRVLLPVGPEAGKSVNFLATIKK